MSYVRTRTKIIGSNDYKDDGSSMFFFPYRAEIKLHKLPTITIAVSVLCLLIYFFQARSEARVEAHAAAVCGGLAAQADANEAGEARQYCAYTVLHVYGKPNPERYLAESKEELTNRGDAADADRLESWYRAFAAHAPTLLTARLWHDRSRFDPIGMLTSSFAHGSWGHVIFNLLFFFAFAASVELVLGPVLFVGAIVALSYGIGLFDSAIAHWQGNALPSLGLSGVVMGMLALFVYFLPRAKIRFFFWFLISVGTIGIPAWIVAAFYIGSDLISQLSGEGGRVNFAAHLSGAAIGFALGALVFRNKRHWARELVLESTDLTQDEPGLAKLNAILVAPVVAVLACLFGLLLIALAVMFVTSFWLPMLLAAPALLAGYQIYRSRRSDRAQRGRYDLGVQALQRQEHAEALKHLLPLAEQNDRRALYTLGEFYAAAPGAMRDEAKAIEYLARAAQRGHAQAQYKLGMLYADGRGVQRNVPKALECYEKAADAGVADAANSLGYLYESGAGIPADREKAIEWYYRAAVGFRKAGRVDDMQAIIRHLESLATKYPAVLQLVAKLKAMPAGAA